MVSDHRGRTADRPWRFEFISAVPGSPLDRRRPTVEVTDHLGQDAVEVVVGMLDQAGEGGQGGAGGACRVVVLLQQHDADLDRPGGNGIVPLLLSFNDLDTLGPLQAPVAQRALELELPITWEKSSLCRIADCGAAGSFGMDFARQAAGVPHRGASGPEPICDVGGCPHVPHCRFVVVRCRRW